MSEQHIKDPEHVAAGYKATIHNPNVSDEAKEHAWSELHKMGYKLDEPIHRGAPKSPPRKEGKEISEAEAAKNEGNVIGGFKATLKNPKTSKEAKQHAESELQERGIDLTGYEEQVKDL